MTVSHGHDLGRTFRVDVDAPPPRFNRYGRLAPQLGAPAASQVRAQCNRCSTHLLAIPHASGGLEGMCPVCLSPRVTAVGAHRAAA
jgi:hypothetical protein